MENRIKFSPFRARMLIMLYPMVGFVGLSFGFVVLTIIFRPYSFLFWQGLSLKQILLFLFIFGMYILKISLFFHQIIKDNLLMNSNIQELRDFYPELEEGWEDLNYADYLDEGLQILVYGDHLICYRTFDIAYLPECQRIRASMTTNISTGRRRSRSNLIHFFATYIDGSQSELRTNEMRSFWGIDQDAHKEALFDYIRENFDYIEVETTS